MDGPGWPLSTSREMVSTTHADAGLTPALKLLQSLVFPVFHPSGTTSANPLSASRYASAATGRPPGAQKRNQNHPAAAPIRPIVFTTRIPSRRPGSHGGTSGISYPYRHSGARPTVPNMPDKHSVLVVEDEPNVQETLAAVLTIVGFTTYRAGNGDEALNVLERERVDAVSLDLRMPGPKGLERDGFTLLKYLGSGPVYA